LNYFNRVQYFCTTTLTVKHGNININIDMNKDTELIWESYVQGRLSESEAKRGKIPFKVHVRMNKSIQSADPEAVIKKQYGDNYVRDIDVSESPVDPSHYDVEFTYVRNYFVENPSSTEDVEERLKSEIGESGRIIAIYDVYSNTNLFGQEEGDVQPPEQQKKTAAAAAAHSEPPSPETQEYISKTWYEPGKYSGD